MKKILAAVVLATVASPAWSGPPGAADGAAIYAKSCASCHGAAGKGGPGPAIAGKSASAVAAIVGAHPPPMDKIDLTPDQTAAVGRYVSGLKK